MLEALVLAAGLGFLLALRFRVQAVVVASAAAVVLGPVVAHFAGAAFWAVASAPVAALVALQCGYLGGLLLTHGMSRAARPGTRDDRQRDAPSSRTAGSMQAKDGAVVPADPGARARQPRWLTNLGCM